jgi:hypothetical protein
MHDVGLPAAPMFIRSLGRPTSRLAGDSASTAMASGIQSDRLENVDTEKHEIVFVDKDSEAERKLLRKLDFTILPLCTLIYLLNFIDRTAVGNALVVGKAGHCLRVKLRAHQVGQV